ncbi:MAG: metallophosphoesterase [Bacilli bacterium]
MIYITGDKHADFKEVLEFCYTNKTDKNDILIILGDSGINYYKNNLDNLLKNDLEKYPITFFSIHGNHEERASNIKSYKTKKFHNGTVYYEEKYPFILFAKDGEVYNFNNHFVLVIGGAYSVDKYYRLNMGYNWYESEQPNEKIKLKVKNVLEKLDNKIDIIFSHTCPYKYLPKETFLEGINQSLVDNSTELFLDELEDRIDYNLWYCGHFHTDKSIDKIIFMFHKIEEFR